MNALSNPASHGDIQPRKPVATQKASDPATQDTWEEPRLRKSVFVLPTAFCLLLTAGCFLPSRALHAQQSAPSAPVSQTAETEEAPLPGDWAPELLDGILSSPNTEARDALHRAAFAAGPAIVPQLEAALKDDRTAEFAAQSLAFIGGEQAFTILSKLVSDPRDLDLRRFYYGALGESDSPQAMDYLLHVIETSDKEPDRTVTEAAILALTVRTDAALVPRLQETEKKVTDVVIHDDIENARAVIEARAKYLATPEGKRAGGSLNEAVRTYFIPALEPPPSPSPTPAKTATRRPAEKSDVKVEVRQVIFSPDKTRALARVTFEDPTAIAQYDMILQKRFGDWTMGSVWLGSETEKPQPTPPPRTPPKNN